MSTHDFLLAALKYGVCCVAVPGVCHWRSQCLKSTSSRLTKRRIQACDCWQLSDESCYSEGAPRHIYNTDGRDSVQISSRPAVLRFTVSMVLYRAVAGALASEEAKH